MTILIIAGIIAFLVGVYCAFEALNNHAETKYGYKPFNFLTITLVSVPYGLLLIAFFMVGKHQAALENGNFVTHWRSSLRQT